MGRHRINGQEVQIASENPDELSPERHQVEASGGGSWEFADTDQAAPAGRYRWVAIGDLAILQRASAADENGVGTSWTDVAVFQGGSVSQQEAQFVGELLGILGDCRLLVLFGSTGTTVTSKDRNERTITFSEEVANFDTAPSRLGNGVAVNFNGTDEEADTPDADGLSFGDGADDQAFSLLVLCKPDVNNTAMSLVAKENSATAEEWALELNSSGHLVCRLTDESATATLTGTFATAVGTSRTLLGATYDGSGAASGLKLYQDGAGVTTALGGSGSYTAMENTAALVHLASRYTTKEQFFDGTISLVAITAKQLTADEMWAIKNLVNGYFALSL